MTIDAPLDAAPVSIPANTLLTSPILPTLLKLALPNTVAMFGSTLVAVAALFRLARRREGGWSGAGVYRQAADGWHRWLVSIDAPAWTLFALVGAAMIVFGLSTAASVRLTRWGK
jgi:hypothetical protein